MWYGLLGSSDSSIIEAPYYWHKFCAERVISLKDLKHKHDANRFAQTLCKFPNLTGRCCTTIMR